MRRRPLFVVRTALCILRAVDSHFHKPQIIADERRFFDAGCRSIANIRPQSATGQMDVWNSREKSRERLDKGLLLDISGVPGKDLYAA